MKISNQLTIAASVILISGCAHHERQAQSQYNESYPSSYYSSQPSGSSTTTSQFQGNQFQGNSQFQNRGGTDQTLVMQVQDALKKDTTIATFAPRIEVTAQNGAVTLNGSVPTDQDKQRIEAMVKSTSGVVSVNNQLQVSLQPTSEHPGQSSRLYQESTGQFTPSQAGTSETEPAKTDSTLTDTSKNQLSSTDQSTTQPGATVSPSSTL